MEPSRHQAKFVHNAGEEHKAFPDEIIAIESPSCSQHDEEGVPPSQTMRFSVREVEGYGLSIGDQHITLTGHDVIHMLDLMLDVQKYVQLVKFGLSPTDAFETVAELYSDEAPGENES